MNDNVSGIKKEEYKSGYGTMIARVKEKYPTSKLYCMNLGYSAYHTAPSHGYYSEERRVEYNGVIKELSEEYGCTLINVAGIQTEYTYQKLLNDWLHPNEVGHSAICEVVRRTMESS